MTRRMLKTALLLLVVPLAGASAPPSAAVHGDYVEVRTASVFCGACHYNGERVTEGRSAILAWNIAGGAVNGVDLTGAKVVAVIGCDDNLAEPAAARRSEIAVDATSDVQATAAVAWVRTRTAGQLGKVVAVRRASVRFDHTTDGYGVYAAGLASMTVHPRPDAACCSQPHLVWYQPLMPVDGRRVAYTESAEYAAGRVGDVWQRSDEDSAFYGTFAR